MTTDAERAAFKLREYGRIQPAFLIDWEQVAHDMHRHFWPGSVAEAHSDAGDCYKCRRMADWLRERVEQP